MTASKARVTPTPQGPLGMAARRLSTATVLFHQAMANRLGLNGTDHKCADLLVETGPVTAGELARLTGLTTGAITGVVDRLQAAHFVRRERDPSDRRRVVIVPSIAPGVHRRLLHLFEPLGLATAQLASSYSADELRVIIDFLERSRAMMREQTENLQAASRSLRGRGDRKGTSPAGAGTSRRPRRASGRR